MAKAVAELLKSPNKWRPYTYVQGSTVTWLQIAELVKTVGGMPDLKVSFEPLDEIRDQLEKEKNKDLTFLPDSFLLASLKLLVPSGR
ncbi:hypothetical protein V7S43_002126 [Phytophthora oleae]|uniref:NmrA-like domain-containing protein n=1 Tax=Phytophthora oleae TaxID=2107226 RepID=A0ABD3G174_9STRA